MMCSIISCIPGYYSTQCMAGSTSDATCIPCDNAPSVNGSYVWLDDQCNFQCTNNFWMNGSDCSRCSVLNCSRGSYQSNCSGTTNNTQCLRCPPPVKSGLFNWTDDKCDFTCSKGFYYSSQSCNPCSTPSCSPGNYDYQCGSDYDSGCSPCTPPVGGFSWVNKCNFTCTSGVYYYDPIVKGCLPCSQPSCAPRTYASVCNPMADSICQACKPVQGAVWTNGCDFNCQSGMWKNGSVCVNCTRSLQCTPGNYASTCAQSSDSVCTPCQAVSDGVVWTRGCNFTCAANYFKTTICQPCTVMQCAAGTLPQNCTIDSDFKCVNCPAVSILLPNSMVWTSGCNYVCASGYYMEGALCLACMTAVQCPLGFTPSACSATQNVQCVPCPFLGPGYKWTYQCQYVCDTGYYSKGSACVPCTQTTCAPGTYRVDCSGYTDAFCVACQPPLGSFVWTSGCSFDCSKGSFLSGKTCVACSTPTCVAGKYASNCTAQSDSLCLSCTRPSLGSKAVVWTSGCDYACASGYFKIPNSGCNPCSSATACQPGTYTVPCSGSSDAHCAVCSTPMTSGFIWTSGCNFVCVVGYYLQGSVCLQCSTPVCGNGFRMVACSAQTDAYCQPCPNYGAGAIFQSDCTFLGCGVGYYQTNMPSCLPCSVISSCQPGTFYVPCTNFSNAQCSVCPVVPEGGFVWTSVCNFKCLPGYYIFNTTLCVLPTDPRVPRVATIVNSTMVLQNTVSQVCTDLFPLLRAVNDALNILSQGSTQFVTNITSLDGQPCVLNACPQCSTRRRALLGGGGISVNISSFSVAPVPVVISIPPPTQAQLTTTLGSTLTTTSLKTGAASAVVILIPVIIAASIVQQIERSFFEIHGEVLFMIIAVGPCIVMGFLFLITNSQQRTKKALCYGNLFADVGLVIASKKEKKLVRLNI